MMTSPSDRPERVDGDIYIYHYRGILVTPAMLEAGRMTHIDDPNCLVRASARLTDNDLIAIYCAMTEMNFLGRL
jgi:hypothetical protein